MLGRFSFYPLGACTGAPAVFLLLLLVASLRSNPAQAAIYISGRVGLISDNSPVADASIALYPKAATVAAIAAGGDVQPIATTQSLGNGSFLIVAPSKGSYHLVVQKEDYFTSDWPVEVTAKGLSGLRLTITRPPTLRLRLIGSSGKSIAGGDVTVWTTALPFRGGSPTLKWDTRAVSHTGFVEVTMPSVFPAVIGRLGVAVRSLRAGCGRIWLDGSPSALLTMHLQPGITLHGKVLDALGNPAPGVRVVAAAMSRSLASRLVQGSAAAVTDEKGRYEIPSLFPDRYALEARFPTGGMSFRLVNLSTSTPAVNLTGSGQLDRPIGLGQWGLTFQRTSGQVVLPLPSELIQPGQTKPGLVIAGRLLSRDTNDPIPNAIVSLIGLNVREVFDMVESGPDGSYSLEAPAAGQYLLTAQGGRYSPAARRLLLPLESSLSTDIEMSNRLVMSVRLLDADGKVPAPGPVQWSMITSWPGGQNADAGVSLLPPGGTVDLWAPTIRPARAGAAHAIAHVHVAMRESDVGCAVADLDKWPEAALTMKLHKGSTVTGTVLDEQGKPLGDAKLRVLWLAPSPSGLLRVIGSVAPMVLADAQGHFSVPNLPDGSYQLGGKLPGVGPFTRQFTVAGADQNITIGPDRPPVAPALAPAAAGGAAQRTNRD